MEICGLIHFPHCLTHQIRSSEVKIVDYTRKTQSKQKMIEKTRFRVWLEISFTVYPTHQIEQNRKNFKSNLVERFKFDFVWSSPGIEQKIFYEFDCRAKSHQIEYHCFTLFDFVWNIKEQNPK